MIVFRFGTFINNSVFLDLTGFDCGGAPVLRVIKFVMMLLDVVMFIVPIVLIVMLLLDFAKNVMAGKEDEMRKNLGVAIKRIIFVVILFLVPTIVRFAVSLLGDLGFKYTDCIDIAINDDLSKYEIETPEEDYSSNSQVNNLKPPSSGMELAPEQDKDEEDEDDDDTSSSNSATDSEDSSIKNIFMGDSRFVGMKTAIGTESDDSEWIAEVSQGYNWFSNTALINLNRLIADGGKYNVIINFGVNDLGHADYYINLYKALANNEKYKNCNFIIVSVNPINDTKAVNNGYKVKNSQVISFNGKIKNALPSDFKYCDTYKTIRANYETLDGIHYTVSTYKNIYEKIKNCL